MDALLSTNRVKDDTYLRVASGRGHVAGEETAVEPPHRALIGWLDGAQLEPLLNTPSLSNRLDLVIPCRQMEIY